MALVLPTAIFFHVGRTAGHWVRKVVSEMEIPTYEVGAFHDWPSNIDLGALQDEHLYFCFVRHPLEWLRSYWCHETQFGWSINEYSEKLNSDSFAEFLSKALEVYPNGPVSVVFDPFTSQCHEVGRQEHLASDLLRILTKANAKFASSILQSTGRVTVEIDPEIRKSATAPKDLLEKVMEVEKDFCRRWGYGEIPPDMIGPEQIFLSSYVRLGDSENRPIVEDTNFVSGYTNAFVLNGIRVPGLRETKRTTMLIKNVLEELAFEGKEVVDVACADGVFSFFAESKGAARVVGVDLKLPTSAVETLKTALNSKVEFYTKGLYGVENSIRGKFDVAFCFRLIETLRYPFLGIRTLSRLMKDGGTLVLECGYIDAFNGVPVMLVPVGSESPMLSRECTFFNKTALMNALSSYGFHDFKIHNDFTHGFDKSRDFSNLKIESEKNFHASDSVVGRVLLSCRWSPCQSDQDPRYLMDGLSGRYLSDYWDSQLPEGAIPEYRQTAEILAHLRDQVSVQNVLSTRLQHELASARSAIQDRDSALMDIHRVLEDRTAELVSTRQTLVERTALLEQISKDLQERTQDLVDTRRTLVERTASLEQTSKHLQDRTADLVDTRKALVAHATLLEQTKVDDLKPKL